MKRALILCLCLGLPACASLDQRLQPDPLTPPDPAVADTQNARLAEATARELSHLARFDPAALDAVEPELRTLAAALAARGIPMPAGDGAAPAMAADHADQPPPRELIEGLSLMHGVHLASYRLESNARAGWETLQAMFPDALGHKAPRLEAVTLDGQGDYLRLKAGPYDSRAEARAACAVIQSAGAFCQTTDYTGAPIASPD